MKVMSTTASHSTLNISETVTDRGVVWFQRTTNRKWHLSNGHVTMTSRDPKSAGCSTVGYPSDSLASCSGYVC